MASRAEAVKTLELFNEKADQLLASDFFGQVGGGGAIIEFRRDSGWDSVFEGPDEEATRALVLTLRMFMRDRDGISPAKVAELFGALQISDELRNELGADRSRLNAFLDSRSQLAISDEGPLTYREILDIFVWGEYAHVDPGHRQTFEDLRTTPFFPMFRSCLIEAIVAFARCVARVRDTNRLALTELASSET